MITLSQIKKLVEQLEDDHIYSIGINDVFSWRGSYDEICFSFGKDVTGKHMKELINKAYTEEFRGYKGGEFHYSNYTTVNFEADYSNYTDGAYLMTLILRHHDELFMRMLAEVISADYLGSYGEDL